MAPNNTLSLLNPNLNPYSVAYSIIITIYTALVIFGLCLLWHHRGQPAMRIRGFLITVLAIIGLHGFVATLFIVYPLAQIGYFKYVEVMGSVYC